MGQTQIKNKAFFIIFIVFIIFIFQLLLNIDKIEIKINKLKGNLIFEENSDFSRFSTEIKAIALYLPQFHTFPENDNWWGKGFTEWTNLKKSKALFKNHNQPRVPIDEIEYLGYYELTRPEVFKKQVKLARQHGIYGFAFYYYWFSGKKLMEKPLKIYLNNKDIDFPFLLIWANENWTRRWDGRNKDILIEQKYKKSDPELFIRDLKNYLTDSRYIKINNKPVIGVYEPSKIPKLAETINIWREKALEYEIGQIYILATFYQTNFNLSLFDGIYEFPPRTFSNIKNKLLIKKERFTCLSYSEYLYNDFNFQNISKSINLYRGSMMEWDNTARVGERGYIFNGYTPEKFYLLNQKIIQWERENLDPNNRYIFINAWNEWAEGTYLEPDKKYGYAAINSLSKALFNLPFNFNKINLKKLENNYKVAVQVHIFNEESIYKIINKINNIPIKFDLIVSTNNDKKKVMIEKYVKVFSKANKFAINIIPNENDILPFLIQLGQNFHEYKYFCHIHDKKNNEIAYSKELNEYLYNNLLGSDNIIFHILSYFENNEKIGIILPEDYYLKNGKIITSEIEDIKIPDVSYNYEQLFQNFSTYEHFFPEGNMFWGKIDAFKQLFDRKLYLKNKFNETITLEKLWLYINQIEQYKYKIIFKNI